MAEKSRRHNVYKPLPKPDSIVLNPMALLPVEEQTEWQESGWELESVFPVLEGQPRTLIGYRFEFICIPGPS